MSQNPPATYAISKSTNNSSTSVTSFPNAQSHSFSGIDGQNSRRTGVASSSGVVVTARGSLSAARNNQSLRKQHKKQKKPRFADEDAMAESAAMKSTNSRKGQTSITHLMNFTLPPRPTHNQNYRSVGRNGGRPTWGLGSGRHAVDKARYVHANYRFLVDPRGDYRAQAQDADVHLEWSAVVQILASSQTQCSACPICLSTPVAPRMAKCGHIFCLPCLIRYMHSADDSATVPEKKARWRKCPICWDTFYISDTRPVRWFTGQEGPPPREGDDIVLRLIKRQPGSTLALPKDGVDSHSKVEDIAWHSAADVADYARVMKASEDYMNAQFDAEIEELRQQGQEDELIYGEEPEWTRRAVKSIGDARERVKGIGNPPRWLGKSLEKKPKRPLIVYNVTSQGVPEMYLLRQGAVPDWSSGGYSQSRIQSSAQTIDLSSSQAVPAIPPAVVVDPSQRVDNVPMNESTDSADTISRDESSQHGLTSSLRERASSGAPHAPDAPYHFYQALLHYYLSPLDIRILKAAYGDFCNFPPTILPRVEHVSTGHIVDDELRKRAKYLAHLPSGCEVSFLECNWTDVVVPEILEQFRVDIERRRRRNQDKEMREEKERLRAEKAQDDQRWTSARGKRSEVSRQSLSGDEFYPLASSSERNGAVEVMGFSASPQWSLSPQKHGSTFASLASPSTSPVTSRTVWGTTAIMSAADDPPSEYLSEPDIPESDGWLQGWERDLLQNDELVAQVEAASLGESSSTSALHGAGKKKKGRKITLMSTNARRGA